MQVRWPQLHNGQLRDLFAQCLCVRSTWCNDAPAKCSILLHEGHVPVSSLIANRSDAKPFQHTSQPPQHILDSELAPGPLNLKSKIGLLSQNHHTPHKLKASQLRELTSNCNKEPAQGSSREQRHHRQSWIEHSRG